jgi:hypothetical protein
MSKSRRKRKPLDQDRFDIFFKTFFYARGFEFIAFLLLRAGYTLISYELLPTELPGRKKYRLDALVKAVVKAPDNTELTIYLNIEFQHTNDPDMLCRLFDYHQGVSKVYETDMVLPIVVYSGERRCTMSLVLQANKLKVFTADVRLVNISEMNSTDLSLHPDRFIRFLAILNHETDPDVMVQIMVNGLKEIEAQEGIEAMNRWYNLLISIITKKNEIAMKRMVEIMQEHPELELTDNEGHKRFFKMMAKAEVEEAKQEFKKEVREAKQEAKAAQKQAKEAQLHAQKAEQNAQKAEQKGLTQGRIESAYLMMAKAGMSFEDATATLSLSKIEQVMLRQRMAQNGH